MGLTRPQAGPWQLITADHLELGFLDGVLSVDHPERLQPCWELVSFPSPLGWLPREEWLLSVLDMGEGFSLPSAIPSSALQADMCPDAVQPSRAKVMELGKAEKEHHTPPYPQHTQCL